MNMRCYVDMLLITSTANIKTWERDNGLYGGLSPLARGTRALPEWGLFCTRFIPAGAGNTTCALSFGFQQTVYPRWRGEHLISRAIAAPLRGLSPLARGTPLYRFRAFCSIRFIPAGAGNSPTRLNIHRTLAVYPRWRGELIARRRVILPFNGLSPLARGTHRCTILLCIKCRFIPAGAGNSLHLPAHTATRSVYPRWRGEL